MYDSYVRTESYKELTRIFTDRFLDIDAPHRDTVHKLVNRFRETGSILDRKPQRTRHVLTEEKLKIGQTLQRSPRKSLSRLSQETGVSQFSAWNATRLLKLKPYKITVVQELQPCDTVNRVTFCNWVFDKVNDGSMDLKLIFCTDEAWFYLNGHVITK
ncbi:hypothetical protein C0J52_25571 [Blattella germanica]|nr:hypothetical protein C0J52_25571 [Blattella germanica]